MATRGEEKKGGGGVRIIKPSEASDREKDVGLRAIINQSREERTEKIRCVGKEGDVCVGGGGGGGGGG